MAPETISIIKATAPTVHLVHNDPAIRGRIEELLRNAALKSETYPSPEAFISAAPSDPRGCLVLDIDFPGLDDRCSQATLLAAAAIIPIILVIGTTSLSSCSRAIKATAIDFLIEPFDKHAILESIVLACAENSRRLESANEFASLLRCYTSLTSREKQVFELVCEGLMNKQTAALLNLSVITVKVHRATLMRKMRCRRLVDLVRAADALNVGSPRYSLAARRRQLLEPDCSFSSPQPHATHEIHVPF